MKVNIVMKYATWFESSSESSVNLVKKISNNFIKCSVSYREVQRTVLLAHPV